MSPKKYRGSRSRRSQRRVRFRMLQMVMYRVAVSIRSPSRAGEVVTSNVQKDLFQARSGLGKIHARRQFPNRAISDFPAAVHDDHARAHFLDQVKQMG